MLRLKIFVLLFYLIINTEATANETGILTGLPIPRYVSLKSNEIKIRIGPGKK